MSLRARQDSARPDRQDEARERMIELIDGWFENHPEMTAEQEEPRA